MCQHCVGSFIWRNDNCNGKAALGTTFDLYVTDKVDGFIGLPCSNGNVGLIMLTQLLYVTNISLQAVP